MPARFRIKPFHELISTAAKTAGFVVPPGCSHSFPIPKKSPSHVRMVSFLYRAPFNTHFPNQGKAQIAIYPPHKILIQDAFTGKVIRFADCKPEDFGVDRPLGEPLLESFVDFLPDGEDPFLPQKEMFMKISPKIWEMYSGAGKIYAPSAVTMIQEYRLLFNEMIPPPLHPFYTAVSSDFFSWLDRVCP